MPVESSRIAAASPAVYPPLAGPALRKAVREALRERPALPLPGRGTRARWRALAELAARDLALAKVLEAHYDAQAICAELQAPGPGHDEVWAVWAAEPPHAQLRLEGERLHGRKAWCSGADFVSHALVTVRLPGGERGLAAVALDAPGVEVDDAAWQALGMGAVRSGEVRFDGTPARAVGAARAYLERPGFWHGGAGVAACWQGGAAAVAERLRCDAAVVRNPHAAAHLGAIDAALAASAALLRETADAIDAAPARAHRDAVVRVRSAVEAACALTLDRVGRALGPAPLCLERTHAQRCADLAVFVRQHHAEKDLQALGEAAHALERAPWLP
ncbi:hypothetical protein [Luteimonas huabeiensis]|uniref:hypothetical protein n=1 Tax=Luteimonas huabeiensis TaxID=1244513 RepID=UPI0004648554